MTPAELQQVEAMVNRQVLENQPVQTEVMEFEAARASGAMALFDEKYGGEVRVLTIGGFSKELCGGTHVQRTGDIGLVKVLGESGIAAGVRRIEAVAGMAAYRHVSETAKAMAAVGDRLKAAPAEVPERLDKLQEALKASEKQVKALQGELAVAKSQALLSQAAELDGLRYLAVQVDGMAGDAIRTAADSLLKGLGGGVVALVNVADGKVSAVATVSDDVAGRGIKAGDVLAALMGRIGGRGSGTGNFAQGGGGDPAAVAGAVAAFPEVLQGILASAKR
ncbi:MAG: DHHA1 domain-containing protein [Candidatus Sericytochromatia bacterium]